MNTTLNHFSSLYDKAVSLNILSCRSKIPIYFHRFLVWPQVYKILLAMQLLLVPFLYSNQKNATVKNFQRPFTEAIKHFLGHFGKLANHLHQPLFTGEPLPLNNW